LKIFVSSTTKDLLEARKKVCERLLQLDIQPVTMDWYTADGKPAEKLDHEKVNSCDAFVIIVGHLYGSCPPKGKKSFTELEYDAAASSGKKIYPFLASNKYLIPPDLQENDATRKKLQAFRKRLEQDHAPRYFDTEEQLCTEVVAALSKPSQKSGRIIVPTLPQPYLAHPYPLQENFTGRQKERAMLTDWVRAQNGQPALSLVGMGGLGKSALTWFWLNEDLPHENLKFEGILWWSFYEQEASFESFISHALLYASGGTIDPAQLPSDYDRMESLFCILQNAPFLLIFDGLERLLRAYHALDAPYKGDNFSAEAGDKHLLCADPRAGQFVQWLASSGTKTRTLITTRLHPKELHNLAGCRKEDLEHLEPDDAVEFMHRQGINGPRTAIIHACEPYDFLPLCLRLLSGAIREDPQKPGDIAAADNWHPPKNLVRKEHHILQLSYDTMAKDRQDLLSRIAAMRGPVDYDTAKVLSTYKNEEELKEALRELVARGLLFRQKDNTRYDLHPIVRQYAYDRLGDKTATHTALKDYFATIPVPDKIQTLDDLLPTIELFHHTISSGAYDEASNIYYDRLSKLLFLQLGAYDIDISLKTAFFPDGEDKPPRLKDESKQAWLLNDLGGSYYMTGQNRKAIDLIERNLSIRKEQSRKESIASSLNNLAIAQILLGELKQAETNLQQQADIAQEIKDDFNESAAHQELGRVLTYTGHYEQADKELQKALGMFTKQEEEQRQGMVWSYQSVLAILMDKPETALNALNKARHFWDLTAKHLMPIERDIIVILLLSGAAKRQIHDLSNAEIDLNDALSRCRRIRLVEFEADILLELAKLHCQKAAGKNKQLVKQAKDLAREALDIADRCEYRLVQADIHNFFAEMAMAESDKQTARKHAEIAKERAYCDGPPYAYQKALDTATHLLSRLP
jgi:tetratricopeptide (TPR) repeat protein